MTDKTPSSNWFEAGEADPHAKRFTDVERALLTLGKLTDDQLANAVFLHNHREMDIDAIMAGEPSSPALLTAAKERIRWLSRKTLWPVDKITVMGDEEILTEARENAGSAAFFKAVLFEMEWNCLPTERFEDRPFEAFEVKGIVVHPDDEEKLEVESVSVHDPRATQWTVYGKVEDYWIALHDSDSLDEALTRAMLLAKIYQ